MLPIAIDAATAPSDARPNTAAGSPDHQAEKRAAWGEALDAGEGSPKAAEGATIATEGTVRVATPAADSSTFAAPLANDAARPDDISLATQTADGRVDRQAPVPPPSSPVSEVFSGGETDASPLAEGRAVASQDGTSEITRPIPSVGQDDAATKPTVPFSTLTSPSAEGKTTPALTAATISNRSVPAGTEIPIAGQRAASPISTSPPTAAQMAEHAERATKAAAPSASEGEARNGRDTDIIQAPRTEAAHPRATSAPAPTSAGLSAKASADLAAMPGAATDATAQKVTQTGGDGPLFSVIGGPGDGGELTSPVTQSRAVANTTAPLQVTAQIADAVKVRSQDQTISVRLDPPELGTVTIDLTFDKSRLVNAVLAADSAETAHLLKRQGEALARELASAGFEGVRIDIADQNQGDQNTHPWKALGFGGLEDPGIQYDQAYAEKSELRLIDLSLDGPIDLRL